MASKIVFQPGIQTMALRYTMSVCDYISRENQLHLESYQRDVTDMRSGEWLNMESKNFVLDSRFVNQFKEFKKPNNVWSGPGHFGTHEHGECGDPRSEL